MVFHSSRQSQAIGTSVTIEPVTPESLSSYFALYALSLKEPELLTTDKKPLGGLIPLKEGYLPGGFPGIAQELVQRAERGDRILLALDGRGEPVGMCRLDCSSKIFARRSELFILSEKRNAGIGRLLLSEALAIASARKDITEVRIEALTCNENACRFIRRRGFQLIEITGPQSEINGLKFDHAVYGMERKDDKFTLTHNDRDLTLHGIQRPVE